jgi:Structure-specific recognition protein (SSRP1)
MPGTQDFDSLQDFAKKLGFLIKEEPVSISGRSWGTAEVENATLTFRVDSKVAFRLPLSEVGQVQQGREEVMLELPVDDTAGSSPIPLPCGSKPPSAVVLRPSPLVRNPQPELRRSPQESLCSLDAGFVKP